MIRSVVYLISVVLISSSAMAQSYVENEECKQRAEEISSSIDASRKCSTVADCRSVWLGCPFGCGTALNISQAPAIKKAVKQFNAECPNCAYRCKAEGRELQCVAGTCKMVEINGSSLPKK